MSRMGLKSPVAGLPCRPIFPKQSETMHFVWQYFLRLNGAVALHKPIFCSELNITIPDPGLPEKSPHERWLLNAKVNRELRNRRNAGR